MCNKCLQCRKKIWRSIRKFAISWNSRTLNSFILSSFFPNSVYWCSRLRSGQWHMMVNMAGWTCFWGGWCLAGKAEHLMSHMMKCVKGYDGKSTEVVVLTVEAPGGRWRQWKLDNNKVGRGDFPNGPVVKNPPSNTGDVGPIPGWGTESPPAAEQLSPWATAREACTQQWRQSSQNLKINK